MRNQPFSEFGVDRDDQDRAQVDSQRRVVVLATLMLSILCVIGVRVIIVQHYYAERYLAAWDQTVEEDEPISSRAGRILTRDGVVLAQDQVRYDVAIDYRWLEEPFDPVWLRRQVLRELTPQQRKDEQARTEAEQRIQLQRSQMLEDLAQLCRVSRAEVVSRSQSVQQRIERMVAAVEAKREERQHAQESPGWTMSGGLRGIWDGLVRELTTPPQRYSNDPLILREELEPHVVLKDVSFEVVSSIQSQPKRFPGVHVLSTGTRVYPQDDLAAHVVGVRRPNRNVPMPAVGLTVGESGIERQLDADLRGHFGTQRNWRDRSGEILRSETIEPPRDGHDVVLTLDSRLQQVADGLLKRVLEEDRSGWDDEPPRGACLVAMEISTGQILAFASAPQPSLNALAHPTAEQWQALLDDPRDPLFPRGTRMALPAGSVFQIVTSIAALETEVITPGDEFLCRGFLDHPDQYRCPIFSRTGVGHGPLRLEDALRDSCHVCFYELARRMGPEALAGWASLLGFGQLTGVDLPGERQGQLPDLQLQAEAGERTWGSTLQLAIGQGELLVTPLQMTRLMAAIANGGVLVQPHVVLTVQKSRIGGDQRTAEEIVRTKIPHLRESTLHTIRHSLAAAERAQQATDRIPVSAMLPLAGRSGTAQVASHPDHAWFVGFAPVEDPRVAIAIVVEQGGSANVANSVAREFVMEMLGEGWLTPGRPTRRSTELESDQRIDLRSAASHTTGSD